jgi:hypothetical protein
VSADGFAICKSLQGQRLGENPRIWKFTAQWSSEVSETNSTETNDPNITSAIPTRKTMFDIVKRSRITDYAGQPYVNGAGHQFNPAMEVEEELSRWEFTQVEPIHNGVGSGVVTLNQPVAVASVTSSKVRPPGIYQDNTFALMIGVTDDTINYFNGAINSHEYRWKAPYTLKQTVIESEVVWTHGKFHRISKYAIVYDPIRWLDKPINAGPFFLAPKLNDAGNAVNPVEYVPYEYIYYTKDIEDKDSILSQDEAGPLGEMIVSSTADVRIFNDTVAATASLPAGGVIKPLRFDLSISSSTVPVAWTRGFVVEDGMPIAGFAKVTGPDKKKTYRAKRPDVNAKRPFIERLNNFVFDFGDYLRVR